MYVCFHKTAMLSVLLDHFNIHLTPECMLDNQNGWVCTYKPFWLFINMNNELKLELTSNPVILEFIFIILFHISISSESNGYDDFSKYVF